MSISHHSHDKKGEKDMGVVDTAKLNEVVSQKEKYETARHFMFLITLQLFKIQKHSGQ